MAFERGKDPKETLGIGKKANALKIHGVHHPPTGAIDEVTGDEDKTLIIMSSILEDRSATKILGSIEKGELNPDWKERYYISFWGEESEWEYLLGNKNPFPARAKIPLSAKTLQLKFELLSEHSQSWVEFNGEKYFIP